jgi:hypothetical protein
MNNKDLRVVNINTTAFPEENFLILTNLSDNQIKNIITPIVLKERNEDNETYDNDILLNALIKKYKKEYFIQGVVIEDLSV